MKTTANNTRDNIRTAARLIANGCKVEKTAEGCRVLNGCQSVGINREELPQLATALQFRHAAATANAERETARRLYYVAAASSERAANYAAALIILNS